MSTYLLGFMKLKNLSIKVVCRNDRVDKNGLSPVYLRVIYKCKKKDYLMFSIPYHDFDNGRISNKNDNHFFYNQVITIYQTKFNKYVNYCLENNEEINLNEAKKYLYPQHEKNILLVEFIEKELQQERLESSTIVSTNAVISSLKEFDKNAYLQKINYTWILKFEQYLQAKNLHTNTILLYLTKLKKYILLAIKKEIITKNPFADYKFKKIATTKTFLTENEITLLENLLYSKQLKKGYEETLLAFLFSVYTGLRHGEILLLNSSHIQENMLVIKQPKTKSQKMIPLSIQAKKIIEVIDKKNGKCFFSQSNSLVNIHLLFIAQKIGLKKKISFHIARHTFATMLLNKGGNIKAISEMLGHTDLKTTQIYTKLTDKTKIDTIALFDKENANTPENTK